IQSASQSVENLPPPAARQVKFERDIQPIFSKNCHGCHGAAMQMNGLRLDNRTSALAGSYSGRVIKAGKSAESKLILLVAGALKDKVMPPVGERLSAEQVGLLRAWIDQGAEWPEEAFAAPAEPKPS